MSKSISQTIDDGGSAFPVPATVHPVMGIQYGYPGMSMRDWFAGQALSGMNCTESDRTYADDARMCFQMADAMLNASEKTQ